MIKNKITLLVISCILLCMGMGFEVMAAEKKESPIVTMDPNPLLRKTISLKAQGANLSEVLKVLAERSGMNFVSGAGVDTSKITIILKNTPVAEAIDLVVRAAGLSYEIIGNSVLIGKSDNLKDEVGQSGYVIALNYANAEEVALLLGDVSKKVKVDKGGNRLIVYASPRVINEIERIVKSIDHPHTLIMLETRLIEVAVDDENNYGVDWGQLSPIENKISYPTSQVSKGFSAGKWIKGQLDFDVALDMLIANGNARLLMNSKLTTTNNREASLHIGEKIPFVVQQYNQQATTTGGPNQEVEHEEVGVKLTMLPHVNEDDEITITLEPEVSSIAGFKGPAADLPLVKIRKTKTTVRVKDGQAVFLAGLLSEEETENIRRVPILGQIPLLGVLFSHSSTLVKRTNLIVEIKPRIIHNPADLYISPDDLDGSMKQEEKKQEMQKK
ncbi:MAG: hypothetical protein HQK83_07965 [Fibrobacteria bacterium]|nr:hypothetical protein [Fibrobacteria bacterium]